MNSQKIPRDGDFLWGLVDIIFIFDSMELNRYLSVYSYFFIKVKNLLIIIYVGSLNKIRFSYILFLLSTNKNIWQQKNLKETSLM